MGRYSLIPPHLRLPRGRPFLWGRETWAMGQLGKQRVKEGREEENIDTEGVNGKRTCLPDLCLLLGSRHLIPSLSHDHHQPERAEKVMRTLDILDSEDHPFSWGVRIITIWPQLVSFSLLSLSLYGKVWENSHKWCLLCTCTCDQKRVEKHQQEHWMRK